jgi:hypothetical protein
VRRIVERETEKESPAPLLGCKKGVEEGERITFNAVEVRGVSVLE